MTDDEEKDREQRQLYVSCHECSAVKYQMRMATLGSTVYRLRMVENFKND